VCVPQVGISPLLMSGCGVLLTVVDVRDVHNVENSPHPGPTAVRTVSNVDHGAHTSNVDQRAHTAHSCSHHGAIP